MKTKFFLIFSLILASCTSSPAVEFTQIPATSTPIIPTAIIESTSTPVPEFEIISAEVLKENDSAYIDYLRPGVNVKVILSNIDLGMLPEEQLKATNFCNPCVGWDNVGIEEVYQVAILHFYSWDLKAGENVLTIYANGIAKQTTFVFEPATQTNSGNDVNPQGEFEIVGVEVLTKDNETYKEFLRSGVNVKVLLSNLDTGLLPEEQLRAKNFCGECIGWDNAGMYNNIQVVILHFYSPTLNIGENTISITAYGLTKEVLIQYDPSIHLVQ